MRWSDFDTRIILGNAANIPDLRWVGFPDEVLFENLLKQGMTVEMAKIYIRIK